MSKVLSRITGHRIPIGIKMNVLVIFLRSLGWGFVDPFYSIYLNYFHENYVIIGLFSALLSFTALISIIPLMRLGDKVKEATIIEDGEVLYFFAILSYIFAWVFKSVPMLLLGLVLNGIGQTFVVVGTESYIRKHNGNGKSGPFAYYIALDYFGWILGMLMAAYAIPYYGFGTMFLFVMPSIVVSFFILPHIRERGIKSLFKGFKRYFHSGQDVIEICKDCRVLDPRMIFFFIIAFFDGMIRMFSFIFIPLFGLSINLSLRSIALLMAVMYLPYIFSYFFSEMSDRMNRMNVIATGLFIGAFSFILLYFIVDKTWVVVLAAAISLSMAIVRPAYNGAITRLTPRRMLGEVTGYNNFIERLGRIVGPVMAGVVAEAFGLSAAFLLIAVIAFGLGLMSLILNGYNILIRPTE